MQGATDVKSPKNETHKTTIDFPHISNRTSTLKKHQAQQATSFSTSPVAICGKSAPPALEGRHFCLLFLLLKKVSRRRQRKAEANHS